MGSTEVGTILSRKPVVQWLSGLSCRNNTSYRQLSPRTADDVFFWYS